MPETPGPWSKLMRRGAALLAGQPRVSGRPRSTNGASSLHLLWQVPTSEPLVEVSVTLTVRVLPAVPRLYFWALQASFPAGAGAHLGLQWGADPTNPTKRHANWGGYAPSGGELDGTTSVLPSSFANPNTRDFDWEPGRPYRLRIARTSDGWGGWVDDTLVRSLDAPGDTLHSPMVWSEVFADCDHPPVSVRWSGLEVLTRSGHLVPIETVASSYQSRQQGGCDNTTSEVDADAFVQTTNSARHTPPGGLLRLC